MAYHPFRHLGLKVLAIAVATLLWLTVAGEQVVERAMRVPLEMTQKPEDLEIVGDPPLSVDVLVRGSSPLLSRLDVGEVIAVLDLSNARPGSRLFPLRTDQVKVPYGVQVAQIVPSTLAVELEKSSIRTLPVVPALEGEPAPGFVVGRITAEPATVRVIGPESRVRKLAEATTETLSVGGERERLRDVVTVGVSDSAVRLVRASARDGGRRDPAGARRTARARPGAVAESRQRHAREHRAVAHGGPGPRPAGCARHHRAGYHSGLRGSCRPRTRPVQSPRSGRSFRSIRRQRNQARRSRGNHPAFECPTSCSGTDGVRGTAGKYPLDRTTIARLGAALVRAMSHPSTGSGQGASTGLRFIVGRDTRESGDWIEQELARGATSAGASVTSAGVVPTPAVAYVTREMAFDAGIVISASHNPFADNGIKVFSGKGEKFTEQLEREVEAIVARDDWTVPPSAFPKIERLDVVDAYIAHARLALPAPEALGAFRIAVDTANGATTTVAPRLFRELGFDVVLLGAAPDGRNINLECGSTHPALLARAVTEHRCRMGVAFDGDGDRAIFVDGLGRIVDGDAVLLMCGRHMKSQGRLAGDAIVATVMSNIGLEIALRESAIDLVRCPVGDKYVMEEMLKRSCRSAESSRGTSSSRTTSIPATASPRRSTFCG